MTPILTISSDWHNEEKTWKRRHDLRGDSIYSLRQIVEKQVELRTPHLALGDLFEDQEPTPHEISQVRDLLDTTEKDNLWTYFVQGQHELVRECPHVPWLSLLPRTCHIHRKLIQFGSFNVYGLDYCSSETIHAELAKIPQQADILATHQVWRDWIHSEGYSAISFADVPIVSRIFTGDYHRTCVVASTGKSGQPLEILSPGSICLKTIDESPEKYFFVLNSDGSLDQHLLKTRHVYKLRVDTNNDVQFIIDQFLPDLTYDTTLPSDLQKPILYVELGGDTHGIQSTLVRAVGDTCHLFVKLLNRKANTIELDPDKRRHMMQGGILSCLASLIDNNSPTYQMAYRLLSSDNVEEEITTAYREMVLDVD